MGGVGEDKVSTQISSVKVPAVEYGFVTLFPSQST